MAKAFSIMPGPFHDGLLMLIENVSMNEHWKIFGFFHRKYFTL